MIPAFEETSMFLVIFVVQGAIPKIRDACAKKYLQRCHVTWLPFRGRSKDIPDSSFPHRK